MFRICAMVKNEHPYLEEWISYHLSIGVEDITIIEDYGSDTHKGITDKFPEKSIHLIHAKDFFNSEIDKFETGWKKQVECYNTYIEKNKGCGDWTAFIDVDEFISLNDGETFESLTKYLNDNEFPALAVFWKCYGASGHVNMQKDTRSSYKNPINDRNTHYKLKSFIRLTNEPVKFIKNVHIMPGLMDINKTVVMNKTRRYNPVYDMVHIDHYMTKSWEDWCRRIKRGNMHKGLRKYRDFFIYNPDMKKMEHFLMRLVK